MKRRLGGWAGGLAGWLGCSGPIHFAKTYSYSDRPAVPAVPLQHSAWLSQSPPTPPSSPLPSSCRAGTPLHCQEDKTSTNRPCRTGLRSIQLQSGMSLMFPNEKNDSGMEISLYTPIPCNRSRPQWIRVMGRGRARRTQPLMKRGGRALNPLQPLQPLQPECLIISRFLCPAPLRCSLRCSRLRQGPPRRPSLDRVPTAKLFFSPGVSYSRTKPQRRGP